MLTQALRRLRDDAGVDEMVLFGAAAAATVLGLPHEPKDWDLAVVGDARLPVATIIENLEDHLRWINEALVRRCERFTMGRSRVLLESLLKATGIGGPPRRSELMGGLGSEPDPAR